jgi:hypothetical protein
MNLNQKVSVPEHVLFRQLDGDAVMLNLADESYFGLDEVGARMWSVLAAADSIAAAEAQLLAEYDVEPAQLQADLLALIRELQAHGLIHLTMI